MVWKAVKLVLNKLTDNTISHRKETIMKDQDIQKKSKIGLEAITSLYEQMEAAQSLVLKNLLATEINAYLTLSMTFVEYVNVQMEYINLMHASFEQFEELFQKSSEQFKESVKQQGEQRRQWMEMSADQGEWLAPLLKFEDIMLVSKMDSLSRLNEACHGIYDAQQIQYDIFNNFSECYLFVIGRDDRDWSKMFFDLGKVAAKHTAEAIPAIAEVLNIANIATDLIDVVDQYDHSVPDYSETDAQLAAIEKHIQVIEELTQQLKQYTEILKAGLEAGINPLENFQVLQVMAVEREGKE